MTGTTTDTDALRAAWTEVHGPPNAAAEELLRLNPSYFARVLDFTAHAWRRGPLEPKVKEFIYCAFDCSATHMFAPGLRQHIANALRYGATAAELMEVFELASGIGVESFALALPALREAVDT